MSTYADHADRAGLAHRLMVLAHREARARYLAVCDEADIGAITLFMSKHELQQRLAEARRLTHKETTP